MTQWFRALAVPAEDLGLVPSTRMLAHNWTLSRVWLILPLSSSMRPPQMPYFNSAVELNKIPSHTCTFFICFSIDRAPDLLHILATVSNAAGNMAKQGSLQCADSESLHSTVS